GATGSIASRKEVNGKELADELTAAKLKSAGMALNLGNETSIKSFVKEVEARYGRVDVLVNNAVSREGFKNLEDMSKEEWEKAQAINSTGMMLLTQAVIRIMRKQKSGNIINIGSIQGSVGPNFPVYGDTGMTSPVNYTYDKWAMVGFTKWIANYYGKFNIRANCISPGGYGPGVMESKIGRAHV